MSSAHSSTGEMRELEKELRELEGINPRKAAEIAYVLAHLYLDIGNKDVATQFGRESIRLFNRCEMKTEEDYAARFVTLARTALPDFIHQEVVRDRLRLRGLEL